MECIKYVLETNSKDGQSWKKILQKQGEVYLKCCRHTQKISNVKTPITFKSQGVAGVADVVMLLVELSCIKSRKVFEMMLLRRVTLSA